jgi:hypothetical protein
MPIGKCIKTNVTYEGTHIALLEYPDGTLVIEGIRNDPLDPRSYLSQRIRFTRAAIKAMLPDLNEWVKDE